jgi:hypothetical protein
MMLRVDLLDALLTDPHADARSRLLVALDRDARVLHEVAFNLYEVLLDRERQEASVFDVLDGTAPPTVVSFDELRTRLG